MNRPRAELDGDRAERSGGERCSGQMAACSTAAALLMVFPPIMSLSDSVRDSD